VRNISVFFWGVNLPFIYFKKKKGVLNETVFSYSIGFNISSIISNGISPSSSAVVAENRRVELMLIKEELNN